MFGRLERLFTRLWLVRGCSAIQPMFYFCFYLVAVSFAICRPVTFAATVKTRKPSTEEKNSPNIGWENLSDFQFTTYSL